MLFNSIEFLIFLPTVFILYWFVFNKNLKNQNLLLLFSSYVFYGWWDYRFLLLIISSTIVDYIVGIKIHDYQEKRKSRVFLWISILFNIGILGFFKYYNFFIDSWIEAFSSIGYKIEDTWTLNIILPVGISFYTFQTMSYSIDIYRKQLEPTKDFISFSAFVAFFPQLVAGPIERATNLLPQILNKRKFSFEKASQGLRLILWGMVKKVVIADSLAPKVNEIFSNYDHLDSGTLWLGSFYFAFQIYCDFSGYSDIAIGTSKLFGFELMSNFKFPYFSRNIGEFWKRWHISLSTWFRDYLYIPLGGSKGSKWNSLRNIFVIFIVSGFWHGANWTFIFWGLLHAILYVPSFILGTNKKYSSSVAGGESNTPSILEFYNIGVTFFFVLIGWVFFRSENISSSFDYLLRMFSEISIPPIKYLKYIGYIFLLVPIEWFLRHDERLSKPIIKNEKILFIALSIIVIDYILASKGNQFIYFEF